MDLTITENRAIGLRKAVFEFDDDFIEDLDEQEREELAQWVRAAILFFLGGRQYRLLEAMQSGKN